MKAVLLIGLLNLVSCVNEDSDSESLQNRKQEEMNKQAVQSVGMPSIVNFQEKRTLKDIIELRDQALSTYTYTVSEMTGKRVFLCDSIGFGISAATQYTNPYQYINPGTTIPQADPNGLYSPSSADGTWVMCLNPETKKAVAMYVEPRIIVSQLHCNFT